MQSTSFHGSERQTKNSEKLKLSFGKKLNFSSFKRFNLKYQAQISNQTFSKPLTAFNSKSSPETSWYLHLHDFWKRLVTSYYVVLFPILRQYLGMIF